MEYCLFWSQWWPLCMSRSDWASWTQGIGTVLAVVAAVLVARQQSRQQREDRIAMNADRIAERFAPAMTLATEAVRELRELAELRKLEDSTAAGARYRQADHASERDLARLQKVFDEVKGLNPLKMPSFASISAVRQIVNAALDAERAVRILPSGRALRGMEEAMAQSRFDDALDSISAAKRSLETECTRLSSPDNRST